MKIVKRIFCHHEWQFERNIYGDEINHVGGKRSWFMCRKCGKRRLDSHLHLDLEDEMRNQKAVVNDGSR